MERDGFPEKYHIIDLKVTDRIVGAGLFVGRVLSGMIRHLPPNVPDYLSEHYRAPGESIKATHQRAYQQAMQFDLVHDVEELTHIQFTEEDARQLAEEDVNRWDSEGTYLDRE